MSQDAPSTAELLRYGADYLTTNYRKKPIVTARGAGCEVFDSEGRRYLDPTAGIAACPLGHGHAGLARAIAEQAGRLIHISNLFYNEPQLLLAARLCRSVSA